MPLAPVRPLRSLAASASLGLALALTPASFGGAIPAVEMTIQVSDGTDMTFNPGGTDISGGNFNYNGAQADGGGDWLITWNFNARPEPSHPFGALIGTGFVVHNDSLAPLEFTIKVTLPLNHNAGAPSQFFGGVGFTLTGTGTGLGGADPSYAQAPGPGDAMWKGLLNDAAIPATTLFDFPDSLVVSAADTSDSESQNIVPGFAGELSSIGAELNFVLTPGEILTVTGNFVVIPAPAAFALLGAAALGRRRRRD
jgi:hypothetical protein